MQATETDQQDGKTPGGSTHIRFERKAGLHLPLGNEGPRFTYVRCALWYQNKPLIPKWIETPPRGLLPQTVSGAMHEAPNSAEKMPPVL